MKGKENTLMILQNGIKFFLLSIITKTILAQNPYGKDPRPLLYFADSLLNEKDYYRAIGEYKRVLFFFPDYPKREWIFLQIGKAYYLGERYSLAKEYLIPLTESKDFQLAYFAKHYLAFSFYYNQDYPAAKETFYDLWFSASGREALGYGIYAAMSSAWQKDFITAKEYLAICDKITGVEKEKDFINYANKILQELSSKKPPSRFWAIFWGILFPGGGHLYLGQWDNALVSFLIVGATGFLAYDGFAQKNYIQAGIFTTFASGFYIGSVYSAYSQAGKITETWGEKELGDLQKKLVQLELGISYKIDF